ncbi:MAG: TrmH family RNA methyltransferase [Defluviitaleaceae bacterium]|nr:TrmH family RNA methyltransferase [Defluviitaleaceae bacterium]
MKDIQIYKNELDYSYVLGAYATFELLAVRPEQITQVFVHSAYKDIIQLQVLCNERSIALTQNDRVFKRLSQKENSFVIGQFSKYISRLSDTQPHVVLVNPNDMGNLGTIIRTLAGVGITNLAIITPGADYWNPKVVRASMGALFRLNIETFTSFDEYQHHFETHEIYPFMIDGDIELGPNNIPYSKKYSLVFGNEATGLPESFRRVGTSVQILQSNMIDSYNLAVSVGIGTFLFAQANR